MFLEKEFIVYDFENGYDALNFLKENDVDAGLVDIRMKGMSGLEFLVQVKKLDPSIEIIMMTGFASIETAINAMKSGAFDYLQKPFDSNEKVIMTVKKAIERRQLLKKTDELEREVNKMRGEIVYCSESMKEVMNKAKQVSASDVTVFIYGESGSGKELLARFIHDNSKRRNKGFVVLDCTTLPENIIESELFGYKSGAFTSATKDKDGLIKIADGGTLFIDEISEFPFSIQPKLLRFLQEGTTRPIGSNNYLKVDARIISASNIEPESMLKERKIRGDLFYRLNVVSIRVPPLRERKEDIPLIIKNIFNRNGYKFTGIEKEALELLNGYDWRGNVRELENFVKRAIAFGCNGHIRVEDIPEEILSYCRGKEEKKGMLSIKDDTTLEAYERAAIKNALILSSNNISYAAQLLNISKATLYRKCKKHGIKT